MSFLRLIGGRASSPNPPSPSSASSVSSSGSYLDDLHTPGPYVGSTPSPTPQPPAPFMVLPSAYTSRRSLSSPYSPSLTSHVESPAAPTARQLGRPAPRLPPRHVSPPPTSSLGPSRHRPYQSLHISIDEEIPPPQPLGLKPRSLSLQSPVSAASGGEDASPVVELSPYHKPLKMRAQSVEGYRVEGFRAGWIPRAYGNEQGGEEDIPSPLTYLPRAYSEPLVESKEVVEVRDESPFYESIASPPPLPRRATSLRTIRARARARLGKGWRRKCHPSWWGPKFIRCGFCTVLCVVLVLFTFVMFSQWRSAQLYSNGVCRGVDMASGGGTEPLPPSVSPQVVHTRTTLPTSKVYVVFWNVLNSFFGVVPFVRYALVSILGAVSPKVRTPSAFNSSLPGFSPNYTGSPLLALPINYFRVIGSHNSYHMASSYPIPNHLYSHGSLNAQLGDYTDGVRQVEIDIHILPGDGGTVVYHLQMLDDHTNCYCLRECLRLVYEWHLGFPQHFPIQLMIEIKRQAYEDLSVSLNGVTCNDLFNLEVALLDVFPHTDLLLPRHVRGAFPDTFSALSFQSYEDRRLNRWNNTRPEDVPTPAEVVAMEKLRKFANSTYGWPPLGSMLGRFMLVWLDDVFNYADKLSCVQDDPGSQNIAMFIAQAHRFMPYSAVQVFRALESEGGEIPPTLRHGLITRSLTTTAGYSFRKRDTARYQLSLGWGIHILSTDFEAPCSGNVRLHDNVTVQVNTTELQVEGWKDVNQYGSWCERLPTGWPFECHPILAPPWCVAELNRVRTEAVHRARRGGGNSSDGYWGAVTFTEVSS